MARILGADGDPRSPLWVIGRDWGQVERARGLPFQGPAGNVLNRALSAAGLRREDCYIDNVVRTQPAGNKWEMHSPETVAHGLAELHALLAEYRPRVVIPLGNEAFRAVMRVDPNDTSALPSITEARGYIWDSWWSGELIHHKGNSPTVCKRRCYVVPAIHPAAALREWVPSRLLLDLDLKRAASELRAGCPPLPEREVRFVVDETESRLVETGLLGAKHYAVDIENFDAKTLACVGFAPTPDVAWVVPAYAPWQLALIKRLCESEVPKDLCNGAYDRYFLRTRYGVELRNQTRDVMLQWHVLQPELAGQAQERRKTKRTEKSLGFLASIWCRAAYWKNYSFDAEHERWHLCGLDCCYTTEIADKQQYELGEAV